MRNLYTLTEDNKPIPAPTTCKADGVTYANPTQATLRRAKIYAYELVSMADEPRPPEVEGKVVVFDGYEIRDGKIHPKFRYDDAPARAPVTYDKYKLVDALIERGVWDDVEAWLKSVPNAYTRAVMAPDISEDEPLLKSGIAAVKELLGWTDKDVADVLRAARIGGAS